MGPDLDSQSFAKVITRRLCMAKSEKVLANIRNHSCLALLELNITVDDLK